MLDITPRVDSPYHRNEVVGTIIKPVPDEVHFGLSYVVNPTKNKSEQGVGDNRRERPNLIFGA